MTLRHPTSSLAPARATQRHGNAGHDRDVRESGANDRICCALPRCWRQPSRAATESWARRASSRSFHAEAARGRKLRYPASSGREHAAGYCCRRFNKCGTTWRTSETVAPWGREQAHPSKLTAVNRHTPSQLARQTQLTVA